MNIFALKSFCSHFYFQQHQILQLVPSVHCLFDLNSLISTRSSETRYIQHFKMSGTEVSAVHRAFSNLLTTLTPEQVQRFMEEVNASATVAARAPASDPTQGAEVLPSKASPAAMGAPEPTETMTRPASRRRSRENAKLRPLNSFIAFRSM